MFEKHIFFKTVLKDSIKLFERNDISKILVNEINNPPRRNRKLSLTDYYTGNVMKDIFKIESLIDRCKICVKLIEEQNVTNRKAHKKLDRISILLSNYYISINTIYDVMLKLVNAVLFTGVDDRDVNQKNILSNLFIKNTKVESGMKQLQKILQQMTKRRNEIVHEYCEDYLYDLVNPFTLNLVKMMRIKNIKEIHNNLYILSQKSFSYEVKKLVSILKNKIVEIRKPINTIYAGLEDIYLKNPYRNVIIRIH
jgi:hypothetical protein